MNKKIYVLFVIFLSLMLWNIGEGVAQQQYTLTVTRSGSGYGTVTSSPSGIDCGMISPADCTEAYAQGKTVSLRAKPNTDSYFAGWSGACTGTTTCRVTMNADTTVQATFEKKEQYTLTVTRSGAGYGTVTSSPSGIDCGMISPADCTEKYNSGKRVTLRAKPNPDSYFVGWSGGGCAGNKTCVLTMNSDLTVAATFGKKIPVLVISPGTLIFESIEVGQSEEDTLTITNLGSGDLHVNFSGLEGTDFSIIGSSTVAVKPQQSKNVHVKFKETSEGSQSGTLKYTSDDPKNPEGEIPINVELVQLVAYELEIDKDIVIDMTVGKVNLHEHFIVYNCRILLTLTEKNVVQGSGTCTASISGSLTDPCVYCTIDATGTVGVAVQPTSTYIPGSGHKPGLLSLDINETWDLSISEVGWDGCSNKAVNENIPSFMPPLVTYAVDIEAKDNAKVEAPFMGVGGSGTYTWIIHKR